MSREQRWKLDAIPWPDIERDRVADRDELFYMLVTASFIEVTSDVFTGNLVRHFADDRELGSWLEYRWEPEELQHGAALRRYVSHVWPEFDWRKHYAAFKADYMQFCRPELLLPERSLELVSRCVVEMGTSCYYTALHQASHEPVLEAITQHIYEDEVRHYKHFYRHFRRYRERERPSRAQVAAALWHRLRIIGDEDSFVSLKHAHGWRHPEQPFDRKVYKDLLRRCRRVACRHFPHHLSAGMLLKPLDIPTPALRVALPVVEGVTRLAMW